ncbi:ABC transporter permease [Hespellia stercorisuis]|uniref:Putative spermidine/putrescine transport system permease protein n=1 Tax=Hespellia stercorisuis DSM 15480 TaxID=1121950 RepID=A0A1M6N0C2_9FIRM|nr:ABC transporter permease subunit [Hespellia stercorisuis]SHJ89217.1 putative spermidine/putrescine transport system permease protein [Hespellia stercorisuis DSM 15480]
MKSKKKAYLFAMVPFLALCILFEIIPVIYTVIRGFMPEGGALGFTLDNFTYIFTTMLYKKAITNSLMISILSSLIGIIVAFIGAKAVHDGVGKLSQTFMSILNMVSNFSGVPLAFAYIIMLGNIGVMTMVGKNYGIEVLANFPLYSVWGLLMIYVYFQIPLATLLLIPAFESIRNEWKEAVALLGGNKMTFWKKVGIPVLLPSILGTFSVLFANALAAYASAYALLMNNVTLLPIRLSEQFVGDIQQRPEFGSAIAVVMMVFMVIAIVIQDKVTPKQGGKR